MNQNIPMQPEQIIKEIQSIVDQIVQKYRPLKIILFGSAGRGEYDKVNDLDFVIIKENVHQAALARAPEFLLGNRT